MAKDPQKKPKKKKPKHTNLVTPGSAVKKKAPTPKKAKGEASGATKAGKVKPQGRVFDVQNAPVEDFDAALVQSLALGQAANPPINSPPATGKKAPAAGEKKTVETGAQTERPKGQTLQFPAIKTAGKGAPKGNEPLPPNTRRMPAKEGGQNAAILAGRRKKRNRWLRMFAVLLCALGSILFFTTGAYLAAATAVADFFESARINVSPGPGFPVDFSISGFKQVKPMGNNGFAAIGDKDLALVSSDGKELLRLQHGYVAPSVATAAARTCVFNRGSTEYTITNRSNVLLKSNTENDILFAAFSPGGTLAMATASQYRSYVDVYSASDYKTWRWNWSSAADTPVMGAFDTDNTTLALACVSPAGGSMATVVYLFKTDRGEQQGAQTAAITVQDAVPVQMDFVGGRLVVVYDTGYAALYNKNGEEMARYDYAGQTLHTASLNDGKLALVFGAALQDNSRLVELNAALEEQGDTMVPGTMVSDVLVCRAGTFVLAGQEVLAFAPKLLPAKTEFFEAKAYGLVWAGKPVLLMAGKAQPLENLLKLETTSAVPAVNASSAASAGQEPPAEATEPEGEAPPAEVQESTPPPEGSTE